MSKNVQKPGKLLEKIDNFGKSFLMASLWPLFDIQKAILWIIRVVGAPKLQLHKSNITFKTS